MVPNKYPNILVFSEGTLGGLKGARKERGVQVGFIGAPDIQVTKNVSFTVANWQPEIRWFKVVEEG